MGTPPPPSTAAAADAARRAFAQVDDLMAEVAREVWVDAAVEGIVANQAGDSTPAAPSPSEAAAIARVAAARVAGADAALLAALGVAADAAATEGDDASAARLAGLRAALLEAAADALPPAARVLDAAVKAATPGERSAIVERAVRGAGSVGRDAAAAAAPPSPDALFTAACQLIDDLEAHQVVPDTRLLARLVLAREDVTRCAARAGDALAPRAAHALAEAVDAHAAALHSGASHVAQLVVGAPDADARRGLLAHALRGGVEAAVTGGKPKPTPAAAAELVPRPGRVLTALAALAGGLRGVGDGERAALLERAREDAVEILTEGAY